MEEVTRSCQSGCAVYISVVSCRSGLSRRYYRSLEIGDDDESLPSTFEQPHHEIMLQQSRPPFRLEFVTVKPRLDRRAATIVAVQRANLHRLSRSSLAMLRRHGGGSISKMHCEKFYAADFAKD